MDKAQRTFIELFCGSGNITRAFADSGFETWKTDNRKRKGVCEPDLKIDFNNLSSSLIPFKKVNVLWAGVPCTAFSFAGGAFYYKNGQYKENAKPFIELLEKCLELIEEINPDFYFIENPRGRMQYNKSLTDFLQRTGGVKKLITLSSYGHSTTKPTHIFTNAVNWEPQKLDGYGRGNKNKGAALFDNMTLVKRQSTPYNLGKEIAEFCKQNIPGTLVQGTSKNKTILNYTGHKKIYGVYHKIINEIPPCKNYFELFAGSASIAKLLFKNADKTNIFLNDIDKAVTVNLKDCIPGATVTNKNIFDILQLKNSTMYDTDSFLFLDPPYLHSTRNNNKLYAHEMTETDHLQLLSAVQLLKCNVMIIHPKCEMYDTVLNNWRSIQIKIRYNKKTSLECLYMNYPKPDALQLTDFLGGDCWERQGIKRKAERFLARLNKLPSQERQYIINHLTKIN